MSQVRVLKLRMYAGPMPQNKTFIYNTLIILMLSEMHKCSKIASSEPHKHRGASHTAKCSTQ